MSTSVASVISHFPSAENGFTTTTSGSVSAGATTVGLNSVAGYANGEVAVLIIDPGNSKKQTFTGVVDTAGSQLTGVVWTAGDNVAHDAGATVVDYASATHISMISKGILVAHEQDGTHKSGATYPLPVIADFTNAQHDHGDTDDGGILVAAAIPAGSITDARLATSAGEIGAAWASWTPTYANLTAGDGTTVGRYIKVGKKIRYRLQFTFGGTSSVGTAPTFTLPVTMASGLSTEATIGSLVYVDASTSARHPGRVKANSTTIGGMVGFAADATYLYDSPITATAPFAFATSDVLFVEGEYEAA